MANKIFENVNLSDREIEALDRMLEAIDASKGDITKLDDLSPVAFTPGAALAIGVANLAFSVYTEYGKVVADRTDIAYRLKRLAGDLVELEAKAGGAPSIDMLTNLKNEVRTMKRITKK
mmetsp:Transcript_23535/g.41575  ORF Transcript_23535/g.41575 Transcript_23535/m.41575 type:complete len:119 (-) Transcript_23535:2110-2466(-)